MAIINQPLDPQIRLAKYTAKHPTYDHSHTDLTVFGKQPITVVCPDHGKFTTTAYLHLTQVHTCPTCLADHLASKHTMLQDRQLTKLVEHTPTSANVTLSIESQSIVATCTDHGRIGVYSIATMPDSVKCIKCMQYDSVAFANRLIQDAFYLREGSLPVFTDQATLRYTKLTEPVERPINLTVTCSVHGQFTAPLRDLHLGLATCPQCKPKE